MALPALTSLLPLPVLSLFALPFFSNWSTSLNLLFFYMTWTTIIWTYPPLHVELFGALIVRLMFFFLPGLLFLAFDTGVPSLAISVKAQGEMGMPGNRENGSGASVRGRKGVLKVVGWSLLNVVVGCAMMGLVEVTLTDALKVRSGLRFSTRLPLPWEIIIDVLRGLVIRGVLQYNIHRYILHGKDLQYLPFAKWHYAWAHSIRAPYSLTAYYDHPVNAILHRHLPLYIPALIFRMHVLTFHLLLFLASLEELFTYSGYTILPSTIMLTGMARRQDEHFVSAGKGNFGGSGVLDWALGTSAGKDVMDDMKDEAEKRDVHRRASDAMDSVNGRLADAGSKLRGKGKRGRPRAGS